MIELARPRVFLSRHNVFHVTTECGLTERNCVTTEQFCVTTESVSWEDFL